MDEQVTPTPAELLAAVVRGDAEVRELAAIGVVVRDSCEVSGVSEAAGLPRVTVTPTMLAAGLLRQWSSGADLRGWAATMLALDALDFQQVEAHDLGRELLGVVWDAAAGVTLVADRVMQFDAVARGA